MSESKLVAVAREMVEGFNTGDFRRATRHMAADIVYEEVATQRTFRGPAEWEEATRQWKEAMPDLRGNVTKTVVSGDTVVHEITWEGTQSGPLSMQGETVPASGQRSSTRATQVIVFDGDKVKTMRHYFDLLGFMQKIGAVPLHKRAGRG